MKLHDGEMEKMYRLGHWTDGKDRPLLVGFKNYEGTDYDQLTKVQGELYC